MTLEKAIEIIGTNGLKPEGTTWGEYLEAVQLGREALKARIRDRAFGYVDLDDLLPGETKE